MDRACFGTEATLHLFHIVLEGNSGISKNKGRPILPYKLDKTLENFTTARQPSHYYCQPSLTLNWWRSSIYHTDRPQHDGRRAASLRQLRLVITLIKLSRNNDNK